MTLSDAERDRVLHGLVDRTERPEAVAERLGIARDAVEQVARWRAETAHERRVPSTPTSHDEE